MWLKTEIKSLSIYLEFTLCIISFSTLNPRPPLQLLFWRWGLAQRKIKQATNSWVILMLGSKAPHGLDVLFTKGLVLPTLIYIWFIITFFPLPSSLKTTRASMPKKNSTVVAEFLFEGFSSFDWQHRLGFFIVFLTLYLLTLSGNMIIVTIIRLDRHLHTPMYFFLSMLSISETFYTIAIIPRMLAGLLNPYQAIDIQGCATQLFFYLTFGINNWFISTVMSY